MRHSRLLVPGLALGVLAMVGSAPSAGAQANTATVNLTALPNSGAVGKSGTATLTDIGGGRTRVEIRMQDATGNHPAHIHQGSCTRDLNPAPAFPLANVQNGTSMTEVNASFSQIMGAQHAINLHRSPQEIPEPYVACGDILMAGAQATGGTAMPGTLPRAGDVGSVAPLFAAAGAGLAGAGYVLRRRLRR